MPTQGDQTHRDNSQSEYRRFRYGHQIGRAGTRVNPRAVTTRKTLDVSSGVILSATHAHVCEIGRIQSRNAADEVSEGSSTVEVMARKIKDKIIFSSGAIGFESIVAGENGGPEIV